MKGVNEMGQTDIQFRAQLLEDYARLKRIKEVAEKENSPETVKLLDKEIELVKLKLQPTELPD